MGPQRTSNSYYVAAAVLVLALGAFLLLTALVVRSPQRFSQFQADTPTVSTCRADSSADACFHLQVSNIGNASGYVQCAISPAPGTSALFHTSGLPNADGTGGYQPSDTYSSSRPVDAQKGLILLIEVTIDKDAVPTAPTPSCVTVAAPAGLPV